MDRFKDLSNEEHHYRVKRLKSNMDRFKGLDLYQIESDIIAFKIQYG